MHVLTRDEMYAIDKYTIERVGIPGEKLMENAGRGCSKFIKDLVIPESKVAIFCGSGNNGGDGFVIARYLKEWQYDPNVFLMGSVEKMSEETRNNYNKCIELNIPIEKIKKAPEDLSKFEIIIDAIFGVGLKGEVKGWRADVINKINQFEKTTVAIDIASGIDADTGNAGIAVDCDFTLTMAALKRGQLIGKGREKSGDVIVIDIGVPEDVFSKFDIKGTLATDENVVFPNRNRFSHKGDYGKVGIIAGSPGFTGAAILASKAALRSGAGLITLFHPLGLEVILENQLLEVMTFTIPLMDDMKDAREFDEKLNSMDVLLIGPGIGTSEEMLKLIEAIITIWDRPLILDADALNIISQNKQILDNIREKNVLLTPHIAEFARLCDIEKEEVIKDPVKHMQKFVKKYNCSILLKSATSIYCDAYSLTFDLSGNDGLSTGGSGDVLAGIIASFVGQHLSLKDAAVSASYLLGETAEKLAEIRKPASIIPSDIIENIFKY